MSETDIEFLNFEGVNCSLLVNNSLPVIFSLYSTIKG